MPISLLQTQLDDLEERPADEPGLTVDIARPTYPRALLTPHRLSDSKATQIKLLAASHHA